MFSYMKQRPGFYKEVVALATPIVLQNLITSALGMADTFMVGMLGETPMAAVALAFGISVGIGILFGYLPARKAAALNPIDALHYD